MAKIGRPRKPKHLKKLKFSGKFAPTIIKRIKQRAQVDQCSQNATVEKVLREHL